MSGAFGAVLDAFGNYKVYLSALLAGEDQGRNVLRTVRGAQQYGVVRPAPSAAPASPTMPLSDVMLGSGVGAAGDYLESLTVSISSNTNAAVYIRDGNLADIASGAAGTAPAGTTALSVVASANQNWTANQYAGSIVRVTYTPTGGAAITVKRKIASHAAIVASTAVALTLSHAIPAGASITSWGLEPLSSWELIPFNTPVGVYSITLGRASVYGGWRLSVDSSPQVEYGGIFS